MKTNMMMNMVLALGTVSVSGSALHAQSYELKANIPFAFQVNNTTYAAGKYEVKLGSEFTPSLGSQATGHKDFIAGASPILSGPPASKLVFHCYDGNSTCFLAEIWPSSSHGTAVPTSKAEKELKSSQRTHQMASIAVDLRRAD